jgi:hypothetical protein
MTVKEENKTLMDKIKMGLEKSYKDLLASKKRNHEDLIILKNDRIVRIKQ